MIHAQGGLHHTARNFCFAHGVDSLHHDGNASQRAMRIGRGQEIFCGTHFTFFKLDGLGSQHGVRKIQVPFVRRCIGTLGHVAQVAHEALVHHFPVVFLVDAIYLHGATLIHQVKQSGKRAAQADAAAASMANVEDALEFIEARLFVVKVFALPI